MSRDEKFLSEFHFGTTGPARLTASNWPDAHASDCVTILVVEIDPLLDALGFAGAITIHGPGLAAAQSITKGWVVKE